MVTAEFFSDGILGLRPREGRGSAPSPATPPRTALKRLAAMGAWAPTENCEVSDTGGQMNYTGGQMIKNCEITTTKKLY